MKKNQTKTRLPNQSGKWWTGHKLFTLPLSIKCSQTWTLLSKDILVRGEGGCLCVWSKYLIYSVCQGKIQEEEKSSLRCFKSYCFKMHLRQLSRGQWTFQSAGFKWNLLSKTHWGKIFSFHQVKFVGVKFIADRRY